MMVFVVVYSMHERFESGSDTITGVFSNRESAVRHILAKVPDAEYDEERNCWIDRKETDRFTDVSYSIERWSVAD